MKHISEEEAQALYMAIDSLKHVLVHHQLYSVAAKLLDARRELIDAVNSQYSLDLLDKIKPPE